MMKKQRNRRPAPRRKPNKVRTKAEIKEQRRIEAEAAVIEMVARAAAAMRAMEARMPPEERAEYRYLNQQGANQPDGDWPEGSAEARRLDELHGQYMDLVTDEEIAEQFSLVIQELAGKVVAEAAV